VTVLPVTLLPSTPVTHLTYTIATTTRPTAMPPCIEITTFPFVMCDINTALTLITPITVTDGKREQLTRHNNSCGQIRRPFVVRCAVSWPAGAVVSRTQRYEPRPLDGSARGSQRVAAAIKWWRLISVRLQVRLVYLLRIIAAKTRQD